MAPDNTKAFLRLKIDQDLKNRFRAKCVSEGLTMNTVVAEMMEDWLEDDFIAQCLKELDETRATIEAEYGPGTAEIIRQSLEEYRPKLAASAAEDREARKALIQEENRKMAESNINKLLGVLKKAKPEA